MTKKKLSIKLETSGFVSTKSSIVEDIRHLVETARSRVAVYANSELTLLYWRVGERIRRELLKNKRAEYGRAILPTLSAKLEPLYGEGFSERNLARMGKLVECFPDQQNIRVLAQQLSWSHFVEILSVKNSLAREFYAEMCHIERWSVRVLRNKIGGMLFERTALSRKPDTLIRQELAKLHHGGKVCADLVFRDPYFLDFLGLKGAYQEKDIETAILRELEAFILEIGTGFSFVARQKRMIIGEDDFYLDLLFFHRELRRLVAIELKLGKFKPEYKGQMELYLRWLDKYERNPGEDRPLGLILCASKSDEQVELLELGKSGIRVAEYMIQIPPRAVLENKLHEVIRNATAQFKNNKKRI